MDMENEKCDICDKVVDVMNDPYTTNGGRIAHTACYNQLAEEIMRSLVEREEEDQ